MKEYRISEEHIMRILSYLNGRPYAEVHNGVAELQSLPLIVEAPKLVEDNSNEKNIEKLKVKREK